MARLDDISIADVEDDVNEQERLKKVALVAAGKPRLAPDTTTRVPASKLERDGFSMPADEYASFDDITQRMMDGKLATPRECVNKSYLIRMALTLLKETSDEELKALTERVRPLKRGAPAA